MRTADITYQEPAIPSGNVNFDSYFHIMEEDVVDSLVFLIFKSEFRNPQLKGVRISPNNSILRRRKISFDFRQAEMVFFTLARGRRLLYRQLSGL
jgi:hypothetical protein